MKIPEKKYSIEEFLEALYGIELESYKRLKLACFITRFASWKEETKRYDLERILGNRKIETENMGQIQKLRGWYWDQDFKENRPATFLAYLDPNSKLFLCFTDEKTEAIEQIFGKNVADIVEGFYYLFIRPSTFYLLAKKICEDHPSAYCTYFSAMHNPEFQTRGSIRPGYKRTIQYSGDDALDVLNEVRRFYGVIPTITRFEIPDFGIYQINNTGIFTVSSQVKEGRSYLLHLANIVLGDVLVLKGITDTADYQIIPVRTEKKTFEIPEMTPVRISLSEKLELGDAESLIQGLSDNGYAVFNYILEKGSLIMSGMLTDGTKKNLFTFDVNNERILIAPVGKPTFDGILRLFRIITENLDSNATCEVVTEEYQ